MDITFCPIGTKNHTHCDQTVIPRNGKPLNDKCDSIMCMPKCVSSTNLTSIIIQDICIWLGDLSSTHI